MSPVVVVGVLGGIVSLLLLFAASHLADKPAGWIRFVLSGVLSGIYSGLCLLPGLEAASYWPVRICVLIGTAVVAFGINKEGIRGVILYTAMQLGIGGGKREMAAQILSFLGVATLCMHLIYPGRKRIPVELSYGNRQVKLTGLKDTGNTLKDPITGRPVLIIGPQAANRLTGLDLQDIKDPILAMSRKPIRGLRLIPYRTIDRPDGLLLGLEIKDSRVGSRKGPVVVAFAGEELDEQGNIQALTGGSI